MTKQTQHSKELTHKAPFHQEVHQLPVHPNSAQFKIQPVNVTMRVALQCLSTHTMACLQKSLNHMLQSLLKEKTLKL